MLKARCRNQRVGNSSIKPLRRLAGFQQPTLLIFFFLLMEAMNWGASPVLPAASRRQCPIPIKRLPPAKLPETGSAVFLHYQFGRDCKRPQFQWEQVLPQPRRHEHGLYLHHDILL